MSLENEENGPSEPQGPPELTDKIKILVVEDDRTTRLLYEKGLFDPIFDKKMVLSGKEAIIAYREWHPDIMVLDIYLPEMTGYMVLKKVRTALKDLRTTIVMATSLRGSEDVKSCMKLGVQGYIVKPFQCADIGAKILGCYEMNEPERARKAAALNRQIANEKLIRLVLDSDEPKSEKTEKTGGDEDPQNRQAGEAGGDEGGEPPDGKKAD